MSTLPQLTAEDIYLTDGGLETTLVFLEGLDLPDFAAFPLLDTGEGKAAIDRYYASYLDLAERTGAGFVLDTPTWRANRDWGKRLGYDDEALVEANRRAVDYIKGLADARPALTTVLNGVVGPRGDGYVVGDLMTATGGRRLPLAAGGCLRRRRSPDDDRRHDDVRRGGDRGHRCGHGGRQRGGHLVHRRDRRPTSFRTGAGRGDRSRSTRPRAAHRRTSWSTAPSRPTAPRVLEQARLLGRAGEGDSRQRLDDEPRRARRGRRSWTAGTSPGWRGTTAELRRVLPDMRVAGGCCGTDAAHIAAIADELSE